MGSCSDRSTPQMVGKRFKSRSPGRWSKRTTVLKINSNDKAKFKLVFTHKEKDFHLSLQNAENFAEHRSLVRIFCI